MGGRRRKIRRIECNAKFRYLKTLTWEGTLRQVFYLSEAPSPPTTAYPPPPLTHYIHVYTVHIFTQGRGRERGEEREELSIENVRGAMIQTAGRKYRHD